MFVDHEVIDCAGHNGEVEGRVNLLYDVISRVPQFVFSFSVYLPKLVVGSDNHSLKLMQSAN